MNALTRQEAVQVHLPQPHRMGLVIATSHRRHAVDGRHFRDGGQRTHRGFHRCAQIRTIHGSRNVERPQVAGNVGAQVPIAQIVVEGGCLVDLQDFRTQVGHGDAPLNGVGCIHRVLEHDVGIAALELDLGQRLEEFTGVDLLLADALVTHHLVVFLGDGNLREGLAVDLFHIVRREQVHVGIALGQLEGHVRNHHTQRQRLDADLLVGILALGVQKAQDVRMVGVQVHRAGALPRAQLVGIRERIFQQLHHRNHTGRLVLDALDGCTQLAQVGEHQRHAATPLGKLQCRIDGTPDALHVVFHTQQEA